MEDQDLDETTKAAVVKAAVAAATPKPTAQANFTDPDARIMKTSDGSFHYCYNAQAIVDDAHQVVVATSLTNRSADCHELPAMLANGPAIPWRRSPLASAEVLALVAEGRSNLAIAEEMGLAEKSVVRHLSHIYDTLGIFDRPEDNRRVVAVVRFLALR